MIGVLGAGAFGTALAVALVRAGGYAVLWGRDVRRIGAENPRLPGVPILDGLFITSELGEALEADILLLAMPMQATSAFLQTHADAFDGKTLVACAKGFDLDTGIGGAGLIERYARAATPAILSGPGFARDIGLGRPTAMTLGGGADLQAHLSTPDLRLYRSDDLRGIEVGGALKNVIAIACGAAIGMGLGESARAALMTRGFAEIQRLGRELHAQPETLTGLSGLGDLALTCTSDTSRNYRFGRALGRGDAFDAAITVEGAATARAVAKLGLDLPICAEVARLCTGQTTVGEAIDRLLSRPLRAE